jgi:type IV fimbrial biogenesis protein FimT
MNPMLRTPSPGFTVLELMISLTIAAILLVIGVPAFQNFSQEQRMEAAINALHTDLVLARSQAIQLDAQVVACPGHPLPGCSGNSDWSEGWIIFGDANADRQRQAVEPLLRHGQGFDNLWIRSSAGRANLRFYPNGSTPGSNASIRFCGLRGPEFGRKLVISNIGRIKRETTTDIDSSDCPPANS